MKRPEGRGARFAASIWVCIASLVASIVAGCGGGPAVIERTEPPPAYAGVAARYNERIEALSSLIGQVTGTVSFVEDGQSKQEEFSGVLQLVQPDRVALSIKKVGQRVAWVGGDGQRAWLIEFGDEPAALIGSHEAFTRALAGEPGAEGEGGGGLAPVAPRDLAALIGVSPLPTGPVGATQWSGDGRLLGLTARIESAGAGDGGVRRTWVDPDTLVAQRVEVFDARERLQIVSELSGEGRVTLTRAFGERPRLPKRVIIRHIPSEAHLELGIGAMRDGPIDPAAFDFDALVRQFGVKRIERLVDDSIAATP